MLPLSGILFPETSNIAVAIGFIPLGYLIWKNRIFEISPDKALDNIITSMQDALILVNTDGVIKYANPAALRMLDYREEDLLGRPATSLVPPDEEVFLELISPELAVSFADIRYLELSFLSSSSTPIPVSVSLSKLVMKGSGFPIGFVCIARDISERKRKDEELAAYRHRLEELVRVRTEKLQESSHRYLTLFRDSPVALLEVDLVRLCRRLSLLRKERGDDIIGLCMERPLEAIRMLKDVDAIQVNMALLQLFDVENKGRFLASIPRIFRKKSFVALIKILEALFHGDTEVETDGIVYRPGGSERFITLKLSFVAGKDSSSQPAIISIVDVTERKRAEEEKAELEEQLRHVQKMEALGTLAGGIAHDFNNLLSGILGYADLMKSELRPDSRYYRDVEIIEITALKAARLVRQLLNFARKGKQHNVTFDIQMIIEEVITILKHTIDKRIRLVRRFKEYPVFIQGDPGQIEQVIVNLAVNACDSMPEGGELAIEVDIITPPSRKLVTYPHLKPELYTSVVVRDTGTGIAEDIRDRIFEPFFTTKEAGKGTGMGLAVVYGIIANHDGIIEVEPNEPGGTVFRVCLPLAPKPEAPVVIKHIDEKTTGEGRILVVDDEEVVCRVIERMLGTQGYSVLIARDGEEAIERYSREKELIDLVLIDMIMPKMNGRDCYRAMRKMNPDLKAVLITGHLPEGSAFEAIVEGMREVIFKPFSKGRLTEVVKSVLAK